MPGRRKLKNLSTYLTIFKIKKFKGIQKVFEVTPLNLKKRKHSHNFLYFISNLFSQMNRNFFY